MTQSSNEELAANIIRFQDIGARKSHYRPRDMLLPRFERDRYPVIGRPGLGFLVSHTKDGAQGERPGPRLIPAEWRIQRQRKSSDETVIGFLGSVEIRRIPAGRFVRTCANGEPAEAREAAPKRLTNYLNGGNRGAVMLDAARPVIQQQAGPRPWRAASAN